MASPEKVFQFRGDLSETTLPEMLYTIDRFQVPGVIEVRRNRVFKRIYIKGGNVIHASSSDLADSLGSYLERTGRITPEQSEKTVEAQRNTSKRFGVLLIEQGFLSPADVYRAIREQIEEIVWSLFAWHEGQVTFDIGDYQEAGMVRIQLPMRQVILQGIKRAPEAKVLVARLGRKEAVFETHYHTESLLEIALEERDYRLLEMVDGRRTLYDISAEGPYSLAENAKLMYAFHVLQLIRKVSPEEGEKDTAQEENNQKTGAIKIRLSTNQPGGG